MARAVARHLRSFLTARTLDTEALEPKRLSILRALPILSSDGLSSVAYGPEVGLSVLAATGAGAGALILNVPIGIAIALLRVLVTTSYRQVVRGYTTSGDSSAATMQWAASSPPLLACVDSWRHAHPEHGLTGSTTMGPAGSRRRSSAAPRSRWPM